MNKSEPSHCSLDNIGVLVTRPEQQAGALCTHITDRGGRAIPLPALIIHESSQPEMAAAVLDRLDRFSLLIFISPNAVHYGLRLLAGNHLPQGVQIAAVGQGTAQTLESHGITPTIMPLKRFDSEALLTLPELQQPAGRRVVIVRGNGGRPLLGDTLQQRGAIVEYAEVYRRECPQRDLTPLLEKWQDEVQIVTATSNEILENLVHLVGEQGRRLLCNTPLVVISERMRLRATELGWREIILAERARDEDIVAAICAWRDGSDTH